MVLINHKDINRPPTIKFKFPQQFIIYTSPKYANRISFIATTYITYLLTRRGGLS